MDNQETMRNENENAGNLNYNQNQLFFDSTIYYTYITYDEIQSIGEKCGGDWLFKCKISSNDETGTYVEAVNGNKNGTGQMLVFHHYGLVIATNDNTKKAEELYDAVCEFQKDSNNSNDLNVVHLSADKLKLTQLFNNERRNGHELEIPDLESPGKRANSKSNPEAAATYSNKMQNNETFMRDLVNEEKQNLESNVKWIEYFATCCDRGSQETGTFYRKELENVQLESEKVDELNRSNKKTILNVIADFYKSEKKVSKPQQKVATKSFKCISTLRENRLNKVSNTMTNLESNLLDVRDSYRLNPLLIPSEYEGVVSSTKGRRGKKRESVEYLDQFLKLQTKQNMYQDMNRKILQHLYKPGSFSHMEGSQLQQLRNYFESRTQNVYMSTYPKDYIVFNRSRSS